MLARKRKIRSLLRRGRRARRARFPTCGVIRVAGYSVVWDCGPTPIFLLKSTKRSAAAIIRPQRSFITFYGALRNILLSAGFPVTIHMIVLEQMFVNALLQIFSSQIASASWTPAWIKNVRRKPDLAASRQARLELSRMPQARRSRFLDSFRRGCYLPRTPGQGRSQTAPPGLHSPAFFWVARSAHPPPSEYPRLSSPPWVITKKPL